MSLPLRPLLGSTALATMIAGFSSAALAQVPPTTTSEQYQIQVQTVVEGLEHPWGMAFLPDGRFLVTERNSGNLRIGTPEGQLSEPLEGTPEVFRFEGETDRSQGGMFDVVLHPMFEENQFVYLSFAKPSDHGAGTAIIRGRLVEEGQTARLEDVETIFEMNEEDQDSSGLHFGGRMAFNPADNTLFLSIGERRNISRAQDPGDQAGSIIRVADDGSVPPDNPFLQDEEADDKIYAIGVRNVQALALNPDTGELWAVDHGPLGGDEINRIEAGQNYGWPYLTSGSDYSGAPMGVGTEHEGMVSAFHSFEETVAPSGLAFYEGEPFQEWRGDMLIGALVGQGIMRVAISGDQVAEEELIELGRRIRDVEIAADGSIWALTEHEDGEVLRLTPADAPVAETP
ncbi:PQQ-dependent sugar dehydrogenase [Telmatospirillum sp. J64-1]|uniref:PQQ-dependent sugar dehydrogenase n=1 Tax=Telmatospirillum sp. J64-1 TaxID=2502183 RepID=UPI00163DAE4E|nr:PQQ-dependent sugar dehydrogenase [Telmatospirillum sp. J64-1]